MNPKKQQPPSTPEKTPRLGLVHPVLRFTPAAWAKLLYFRDRGDTEIGGFGVAASEDPLLVTHFEPVLQNVTAVAIAFDDEAVADFYDRMIDQGLAPRQFARIWCHTHPGDSATPSGTDEQTFERVFGSCDWAVMFIIGRSGKTSARLRHNTGPRSDLLLDCQVDYQAPFEGSDQGAWAQEFEKTIRQTPWPGLCEPNDSMGEWMFGGDPPVESVFDWDLDVDPRLLDSLQEMDGPEQLHVLRELGLLEVGL